MYIHGMGSYRPPHKYTKEDIQEIFCLENGPDWVKSRLCIDSIYSAMPIEVYTDNRFSSTQFRMEKVKEIGMTPTYLAVEAAKQAIERAGIDPKEIGMVIANTDTPECNIPPTADKIAAGLNISPQYASDIQNACSSFAFHMKYVEAWGATPGFLPKYILTVQTGAYTLCTNYTNPKCIDGYIWGDGAAAQIISFEEKGRMKVKPGYVQSDSKGAEVIQIDPHGYFFQEGSEVYKFAKGNHVKMFRWLAEQHGDAEKAYTVSHQASRKMQKGIVRELKEEFDGKRHLSNAQEQGNTAAAGCPSVIAQNWDKFVEGDKIFYAVVGAGFHWGCGCLEVTR